MNPPTHSSWERAGWVGCSVWSKLLSNFGFSWFSSIAVNTTYLIRMSPYNIHGSAPWTMMIVLIPAIWRGNVGWHSACWWVVTCQRKWSMGWRWLYCLRRKGTAIAPGWDFSLRVWSWYRSRFSRSTRRSSTTRQPPLTLTLVYTITRSWHIADLIMISVEHRTRCSFRCLWSHLNLASLNTAKKVQLVNEDPSFSTQT